MKLLDDLKAKLTPKTPAERERMKRLVVYTLLTLSCLVCLWLIFAPSDDEETAKGKANMELPDQTSEGMPKTKIAAYEQEDMQKEKAQNDSTINAVTLQLDTVTAPAEPVVPDEIQNSANAYQQAQASLQDFMSPIIAKPNRWRSYRPASTNWRCRTPSLSSRHSNPTRWHFSKGRISLPLSTWVMATAIIRLRFSPMKKANATFSRFRM